MNSISDILAEHKDDDVFSQAADHMPHDSSTHAADDTNTLPDTNPNLTQLKAMIYSMRDQLDAMARLINGEEVKGLKRESPDATVLDTGERVIEGVFTGEKMVGADGKEYPVPPNYASKSKLVEGDMMKLTITKQGRFIYKQISTTERKRLTGELVSDPATGQWGVLAQGKLYKILTASVTFYKGNAGDEVFFLVPSDGDSSWGAVENIINK